MTSSEGEGQPPPRKRSRTSANSDEASGKKARGRPRVDTQDATAAERRRTQIRLAQRAYRQRKETTISSLEQKNNQLQSIIEQMNKSFLRFNDSTLKSGLLQLNPSLAHELKHVTEVFVTLAKSTNEGNHEDDEAGEADLNPIAALHDAATSAPASRETRQTHANPLPVMSNSSYKAANQLGVVRARRPLTTGRVLDQSKAPTDNTASQQQLPFRLVDLIMRGQRSYPSAPHNPQIYSVDIPAPEITPPLTRPSTPSPLNTKTLSLSWTYSHEETTFARRLTRATLEAGFHLSSMANLQPATLNYVFRLTLLYMPPDQLHDRFKMLLARGTGEDLDFWETPFIHLGGAGTHYPRKDAEGNVIPIPNAWTVRSVGPLPARIMRAENTVNPSQSHDLNVDLTAFEGEWFDANDVQGYLEEEKGCYIDPKDSFTEVLVEVEDDTNMSEVHSLSFSKNVNMDLNFPDLRESSNDSSESPGLSKSSSSAESMSNRSTPVNSASGMDSVLRQSDAPFGLDMGVGGFSDFEKFSLTDPSDLFEQPLGLDLAPGFDTNQNTTMAGFSTTAFGDTSNPGLDLMGGDVDQLPVVKLKKQKAAWIDVSKLIDEIIKHGVCLGRSPGYRRRDVDMAFNAALIQAF